jgi:hypothetical protein
MRTSLARDESAAVTDQPAIALVTEWSRLEASLLGTGSVL